MLDRKAPNLERRFRVLHALQGGVRPTARQLAQRFGVTLARRGKVELYAGWVKKC